MFSLFITRRGEFEHPQQSAANACTFAPDRDEDLK